MKDNANKKERSRSLAFSHAVGDDIRGYMQYCRDQNVAVISQTTAILS